MNAIRLLLTFMLVMTATSACNETGGTSSGAASGAGGSTGTGKPKSDAGNVGGSYAKGSGGW